MPFYVLQLYDEWLDFRIAELISLFKMHSLDWTKCVVTDYGLIYAKHIIDSLPEVSSSSVRSYLSEDTDKKNFHVIHVPSEGTIRSICSRSVLIKHVYELWGMAASLSDLVALVADHNCINAHPYLSDGSLSWSISINTFGKTLSMSEKQLYRSNFRFLDFKGPVSLDEPMLQLFLCLDFSNIDRGGGSSSSSSSSSSVHSDDCEALQEERSNTESKQALNGTGSSLPCYFGRLVCDGGMKEACRKYDLKKRFYLGPTTLDDSLALILANLSRVSTDMLVYDPFVGTASILIALTHFGAMCFGSDIDTRVLRGEMYAGSHKGQKTIGQETRRDIFENFKRYNLPAPELIRMDNHVFDRHITLQSNETNTTSETTNCCTMVSSGAAGSANNNSQGLFDAIVTDPPYGIRAGAKKSGKSKGVDYSVPPDKRADHIPSTQKYPVEEVLLDLLHTAARSLVIGGLLTYLIPTTYDFTLDDLPLHPCLELLHVCHQPLSARHGRRAVVMRKHCFYSDALEEEFSRYKEEVTSGRNNGFGLLMGKLIAALDTNAFENDSVVKNLSVRSTKRKQNKDYRRKQREEGIYYPSKNQHLA